jgi:branched-chain amino acid transport system ATP-binding protein
VLKVKSIEVAYKAVIKVLHGVSLEISESQVICVLGANGAGKSTLLKAISGLLHIEDGQVVGGRIEFDGHRIDLKYADDIARMGIIQMIEGRLNFDHLTVEENLMVGASIRDDRPAVKSDLQKVYGYFPRLRALRRKMGGYLSGGEQQMLVLGRGMMARPRILLIDEPSLGLSPLVIQEICEVIRRINAEQKTSILLVEQNVAVALNLAQYGYVMENGMMVLDGPVDKLKQNKDIREFYMGLSAIGDRKSYRELTHYKRRKRWL